MNIAKISAVLKKFPEIVVFKENSRQYISNGYAVYDITDLPELYNAEQVFAVLGIASTKQDKYDVKIKDELPEIISSDDYGFTVDPLQTEIKRHYGESYRIFKNDTTAIFVQQLYLKPLEENEPYTYSVRDGRDGTQMLVVEYGLLGAIMYVMEYRMRDDRIFQDMADILRLAKHD